MGVYGQQRQNLIAMTRNKNISLNFDSISYLARKSMKWDGNKIPTLSSLLLYPNLDFDIIKSI